LRKSTTVALYRLRRSSLISSGIMNPHPTENRKRPVPIIRVSSPRL
jgi:hypothetical protein